MTTHYTPAEYAENVLHGKYHAKTDINWIKKGHLPGEGESVKKLPNGRFLIAVNDEPKSNVDRQFEDILKRRGLKRIA